MINKIVRTEDGNIWFIRQVDGDIYRLQNGSFSLFAKRDRFEIIPHIDPLLKKEGMYG